VYKGKRIFDIILSLLAMPIVLPIIILSCLLLIACSCRLPFFLQQRPGQHAKLFTIIKLKTMYDEKPVHAFINQLGKWLRKYSLDELPQFFNVLRGEMSVVGPRPLLQEYLPHYNSHQRKRHETKPGITGWAQIHGRNTLDWRERFELDVWYVRNQSLWLDIQVILKTWQKIFHTSEVIPEGLTEEEKFKGNSADN
jgi:lipopolysaccharide/colanic/teichoic acid biosynthesis glycosyltransferase